MHATPNHGVLEPSTGANCPSAIEGACAAAAGAPSADSAVGDVLRDPLMRAGRVIQDLASAREISDAELLQHRADCTRLMEEAAVLWMDGRESRETVEFWQARATEAHQALSPAWKAAREAEIDRRIARGGAAE